MRYGRGGGQETKNAICILSLNIINDKVSVNIIGDYWHERLLLTGVHSGVVLALCAHNLWRAENSAQAGAAVLSILKTSTPQDADGQIPC